MPLALKTRIRSGYIIAFLLLLVTYFLIFYTVQGVARKTTDVMDSYQLINKANELQSALVDAETAVRGYVISGREEFLQPYNHTVEVLPKLESEFNTAIHEDRKYISVSSRMHELIKEKMQLVTSALNVRRVNNAEEVSKLKFVNRGRIVMDSIRQIVSVISSGEEKQMQSRTATLTRAFNSTDIIAMASLMIAIITITFSLVTFNRENKARVKADKDLLAKVDELKKANEELESLKQIEKFAATGRIARTIAHEVRNPLTNISLATDQLLETTDLAPEAAMLFKMIKRNTERINLLVTDLLQSTRFAQLEFAKQDLSQLLDETLEMARDRISLKQIQVVKQYPQKSCEVPVDAEKMRFALLNIIVNAIEAMEANKGVLTLAITTGAASCTIEIRDNGTGMDEETQKKIFEPYFTGKTNGTGLGLTNTQNIIFNHRGNIIVRSQPGNGTSFFVTLHQ